MEKHITVNSMTSFSDDILIIFDNLVPRALFPGFAVGAPPPKPEKSTLGTRLNFGKISSCDSHVTLTWYWFLRKGECGRHLIRSSWDSQGQGYRTVELYNSPARIIKRNAVFRAFLYNNGVYYYFFQEVRQLENKIDKLRRLRHPRIVHFHGSEQKGDVIYIFLDFMAGVRVFFNA